MAQEPQNGNGSAGFGDSLALFRRLSSQTVASSFQTQSRDQFGAMVYNRSNATLANLSTPLGANAVASGNRSTAIGAFANAREDSSSAYGIYAQAFGPSSIAMGDQSKAAAYRSVAIGPFVNATGIRSVGIGTFANPSGRDSVAIGTNAMAAVDSVSIGSQSFATATGGKGVAIGASAQYQGIANSGGIAIGFATSLSGDDTIAIGNAAQAGSQYSGAFGSAAGGLNANSWAFGRQSLSTAMDGWCMGRASTTTTANTFVIGASSVNLDGYIYGDWRVNVLGKGLYFKEGTNATYGRVTLSGAGTAIIYSSKISATSQILLTPQNASGTAGSVSITTSTSGIKATVGSTSAADTRTIAWLLLESA